MSSDFIANVDNEGTTIRVSLIGSAEMKSHDVLEQVLANVDREMIRARFPEAVIDLRELKFMNSSSLKSIISWISHVRDRPANQRYFIRFVSNPKIAWQQRSLHAVRAFADSLIRIDE